MILDLVQSHSENDGEKMKKKRDGSRPGRARNINRESKQLDEILYRQYFSANPIYNHSTFCAPFCVLKPISNKIFTAFIARNTYFAQQRECTGVLDLLPFREMTVAMRAFGYGVGSDAMNEKFGMTK